MDFSNHGAELLYSLLLLAFLLTSFAGRKIKFSKIIKYSSYWIGAALVFIIIYSYRFELLEVKSRVLGEINPRQARANNNGQIIINLAKDGHFYVNVKINKVPVLFMIDTGASDVVIATNDAKKIGLNIANLQFNKPYQTANGTSFGAGAIAQEIEFASVKFNNVPISVNSANMGTSLLGMSLLRKFKKYEFYRDKLVLTLWS